jgi:hypothetical protein
MLSQSNSDVKIPNFPDMNDVAKRKKKQEERKEEGIG